MTDTQQPPPDTEQEQPVLTPTEGDEEQPASVSSHPIPVLSPPEEREVTKANNRFTVLLIAVALTVLLGVAAIMVWVLPVIDRRQSVSPGQSGNLQETRIPPDEGHRTDQLSRQAEKILGGWLKIQAIAEAENVSAWGADSYQTILNKAAEGDRLLLDNKLIEAERTFQQAIADLHELLASKNERLTSALANGETALAALDSRTAAQAFDLALTIDRDNEQALHGAERSRNLDRVIFLYHSGLKLEEKFDLESAKKLLRQAVAMDEEYIPARAALSRIENRMQELSFQGAMSRTLKSLEKNDLTAARQALREASRLRPSDSSVMDLDLRIAAMEKAQKLARLQDKAEKLAIGERWAEAIRVYDEVLTIDPQFGFAEEGGKLARDRYELDQAVQAILARPERLQERGVLTEVEQVLASIENIDNPGPKMLKQRKQLAELIRTASTPAEIILRSDNATSVVIYRVGRFGQFQEKRVSLRPGTYTVVGTRPGFRDVRKTLKVRATDNPTIFEIRCKEPI